MSGDLTVASDGYLMHVYDLSDGRHAIAFMASVFGERFKTFIPIDYIRYFDEELRSGKTNIAAFLFSVRSQTALQAAKANEWRRKYIYLMCIPDDVWDVMRAALIMEGLLNRDCSGG